MIRCVGVSDPSSLLALKKFRGVRHLCRLRRLDDWRGRVGTAASMVASALKFEVSNSQGTGGFSSSDAPGKNDTISIVRKSAAFSPNPVDGA